MEHTGAATWVALRDGAQAQNQKRPGEFDAVLAGV